MQVLYYRNFLVGVLISAITALYLLLSSWLLGKDAFFLMLNADLGTFADHFFHYWTYMGDGGIWVPVVILVIIYKKKMLPLIIAAIVLSTLITQLTKNYVFPGEPRPTYGLIDLKKIHTVEGVELHTVNSFPSGHTGTAFTVFLVGCLLLKSRWFTALGFISAAFVGYSRIYLAQHFPLDVGAGIIAAIITVFVSLEIQKKWIKPA